MVWTDEGGESMQACTQQEVENEKNFLLWCRYFSREREEMERYMSELVEGFWEMSDRPKVALTLTHTSREKRVVRTLETDGVEAKICVTTRAAV